MNINSAGQRFRWAIYWDKRLRPEITTAILVHGKVKLQKTAYIASVGCN